MRCSKYQDLESLGEFFDSVTPGTFNELTAKIFPCGEKLCLMYLKHTFFLHFLNIWFQFDHFKEVWVVYVAVSKRVFRLCWVYCVWQIELSACGAVAKANICTLVTGENEPSNWADCCHFFARSLTAFPLPHD